MSDSQPLVQVESVHKTYRLGQAEVHALRDVTLSLPSGEFTVLVGPSGSGKTSLLNLIGGLDRVTSGVLRVAGRDLTEMNERDLTRYRRDTIGFIFQFFNLVPTLTARENVELVAELVADPLDAMEVLDAVGLADRADHFPSALSGGEQQRVAIARALVKRPALVLADEPTGNLDSETGSRVLEVMQESRKSMTQGYLLVTHNQEITQMADRVVHLHSGTLERVQVNPHPARVSELQW